MVSRGESFQLRILLIGSGLLNGFEGREFSTQDIIDRLGIVDTDQVRQILTPLRNLGLVIRTKNDAKAMAISKARKIPKRAVPMFKVIENPANINRASAVQKMDDEPHAATAEVRLYLGNIGYKTTTEAVYSALEGKCLVLSVEIPESRQNSGRNRGFAFAVVEPLPGASEAPIDALQELEIEGRKISVRLRK